MDRCESSTLLMSLGERESFSGSGRVLVKNVIPVIEEDALTGWKGSLVLMTMTCGTRQRGTRGIFVLSTVRAQQRDALRGI